MLDVSRGRLIAGFGKRVWGLEVVLAAHLSERSHRDVREFSFFPTHRLDVRSESTPGVHFRGPGILGNVAWGRRARGARGRGFPEGSKEGHVTSHARTRWSLSPILSDFVRPTSRRRERRASFECMTHVAEFGTIARAWCFSNVDQAFLWVMRLPSCRRDMRSRVDCRFFITGSIRNFITRTASTKTTWTPRCPRPRPKPS